MHNKVKETFEEVKALAARVRIRRDYKLTFSTPHGRRVFADIMRNCHVTGDLMVPGDSHMSSYMLGLRAAGIDILKKTKTKAQDLPKLEEEIADDNGE